MDRLSSTDYYEPLDLSFVNHLSLTYLFMCLSPLNKVLCTVKTLLDPNPTNPGVEGPSGGNDNGLVNRRVYS